MNSGAGGIDPSCIPSDGMQGQPGQNWHPWVTRLVSCSLLFLCMAYPAVPRLVVLKTCLLAIVLATIVSDYLANGRPWLHVALVFWAVGLSTVGFFFTLEGMLKSNPGAPALIYVYVLWPIVFTLWISGLSGEQTISWISNTMVLATLFTGLYAGFYLLTQLHLIPDVGLTSTLSFGWEDESFGKYDGYTEMAIAGMNTFPFLLPSVMAGIAIQATSSEPVALWRRVAAWVTCLLGWVTALAAGRRALLLIMLLTPFLVVGFRSFQPPSEKSMNRRSLLKFATVMIALAIVVCIGLGFLYEFDLARVFSNLAMSVDLSTQSGDPHAMERRQQMIALMHAWLEKPLLGAGLGASALGSIRSETTPWAYELSYLALLFQTGVVGFLAYAAGVLWIFAQGIKIIRQGGPSGRAMLPMLVGLCGMLVANATNPYLAKFDGMWMLFLPLAVINHHYSCSVRPRTETKE